MTKDQANSFQSSTVVHPPTTTSTDASTTAFSLEDEEAFPTIASQIHVKSKNVRANRRITPTPVTKRETVRPSNSTRNTAFDVPNVENEAQSSFNEERKLLRQERQNLQLQTSLPVNADQTRIVKPNLTKIEVIKPGDISLKSHVDSLASLYAALINESLVPCLSVELYFTFQLLTIPGVHGSAYSNLGLEDIFLSAANCVYFASQVLFLLRNLLVFLDHHTLRLLAENSRLESFCPELKQFLLHHLNSNENISRSPLSPVSTIRGVAFHSDTDNRSNFVNEQEFNLFKKKRDIFYGLIRDWETNHDDSNWSMEIALGGKIKSLVEVGGDSASSIHFARLFQAQLVVMCREDYLTETDTGTDLMKDLTFLKTSNPEKLKMLEKRFRIPYKFGGVSPPPTFPSYQEFFKIFICTAGSYHFHQHLGDVLSSQIRELHSCLVNLIEGVSEEHIDCATRMKVLSLLMTLKLLAKFLGLVVFLPYSAIDLAAKEADLTLISSRNSSQPMFDIDGVLDSALKSNTVVLVIPWMVDFLSMMDSIAPRLSYYQKVIRCCYHTYKSISCVGKQLKGSHSRFLFRVLLEWLFQIFRSMCGETILETNVVMSTDYEANNSLANSQTNIDPLKIIDERILYLCCPYLKELKYLLLEFCRGVSCNSSSTRKIKPISTNTCPSSQAVFRQLELKLEENFLHNQPTSVKAVVEFVSDRVSSNVIKQAKDLLIPKIKRGSLGELNTISASLKEDNEDTSKSSKLALAQMVVGLAKSLTEEIRVTVMEFVNSYCPDRISAAVQPLLAEATSKLVEKNVIRITVRLTVQRVSDWMNSHVTENILHKEMLQEVHKNRRETCSTNRGLKKCVLPHIATQDSIRPQPSEVLNSSMDLLRRLWSGENRRIVTSEEIYSNLQQADLVLESRQIAHPLFLKSELQLNVDLAVSIIVRQPSLIDDRLQSGFIAFWMKWKDHMTQSLNAMFSVRNFHILMNHSNDLTVSWRKWELLTMAILKSGLVTKERFLESWNRTVHQTWTKDFFINLESYKDNVSAL